MSRRDKVKSYGAGYEPVVIKIGGSLIRNGRVASLLNILARARRPLIIVAGGGSFADEVRRLQPALTLSDKAAHEMALLAMHQNALALADMQSGFSCVDSPEAIEDVLAANRTPVWLPSTMCASDAVLAQDWSVTSDGLSARLAERLGIATVALLKSRSVPTLADLETLGRAGVVDPAFCEIVTRAKLNWYVVGPGEERRLCRLVLAGHHPTTYVGKPSEHTSLYRAGPRPRRVASRR